MTCRHSKDDPTCSSYESNIREAERLLKKVGKIEDFTDYEIEDMARVGPNVVMRIAYTASIKAILVFLNTPEDRVIRWRKIVPAFKDTTVNYPPKEAPSPDAMFRATDEGWQYAISFASLKCEGRP
jgi:hypothetical protein